MRRTHEFQRPKLPPPLANRPLVLLHPLLVHVEVVVANAGLVVVTAAFFFGALYDTTFDVVDAVFVADEALVFMRFAVLTDPFTWVARGAKRRCVKKRNELRSHSSPILAHPQAPP